MICPSPQAPLSRSASLRSPPAGCAVGPEFHQPQAPAGAGYLTAPLPEDDRGGRTPGDAQHFVAGQDVAFKWWEAFGSPGDRCAGRAGLSRQPDRRGRASGAAPGTGAGPRAAGLFLSDRQRGLQLRAPEAGRATPRAIAPGRAGQRIRYDPAPQPAGTTSLNFNFQTAQLTVGFVPDVFGGNRRKVESLDAQAQHAALRAGGDLRQPWPPTSWRRRSRRHRRARRSQRPARSSTATRSRCDRCATSSSTAMPCASIWPRRSCSSRRRGRCCRRWRSSSSRRAI